MASSAFFLVSSHDGKKKTFWGPKNLGQRFAPFLECLETVFIAEYLALDALKGGGLEEGACNTAKVTVINIAHLNSPAPFLRPLVKKEKKS